MTTLIVKPKVYSGKTYASGAALGALPHLTTLRLPSVNFYWTDYHQVVLPRVASLAGSHQVLATVIAPNVVHVESLGFGGAHGVRIVPANARSIHVHDMHLELLAALSRQANLKSVSAKRIWRGDMSMHVVTLEYRQGHPVWRMLARHLDLFAIMACPKRLVVHVVHVDDADVAMEELAMGIAAF
ncbi:hypothetical protein AMAG_14829 [Allomyces macrogynus ATCC 38327]|uniref:Uncharacterized protein n=1 Tax=Allomyces macrogynus (strain ATCC 38327) TaxID=578462 RepID=A0A0L0T5N5_ALLM3|nr:hypothetical protein AMAG_14829 [Allomyces macrogynus ATCC 38327]|eukprot:KNE69991.1 hypothetical protein AMAG_14829 [Allomyces macrogynus ATCC 38327]